MRALLTGIAGFAGSHLAEYLLHETAVEVHGVVHRHDRRIQHLISQLHLHRGDLRNALWVSELVQTVQPDLMLHLAAWSDVGGSWQQPWTTYELNIQCQLNLLEALRRWAPACRTLVVTSNEVYGLVRPEDLPINEATPFRPNSPYGVSKVTQDMMALQYWYSHQLPTIRVRSFNHIGPDQADDFVASAFARQIAEIEAGKREPVMHLGNMAAERDFTDVRDVVRAYLALIQKADGGQVYNVCSGRPRSVQALLDVMLAKSSARIDVRTDPTKFRVADTPVSFGDSSRIRQTTGWEPRIDFDKTIEDILDDWRNKAGRGD